MLLITAEELNVKIAESRRKNNLLIVDARPFSDYAVGHIPDAVNIDLMQFHWIDTTPEGIRQFNGQTRLLLSNLGVSKNKLVVFYDDVSGPSAARGVWLLLYFSYNNVAILDGGLKRWNAKGLPLQKNTNPFLPSRFEGKPDPRILATYREVKSFIGKKGTVILDARSKAEFDGSLVRAARAGHIPEAVNIDWNENLDNDATFKDTGELARLYSSIPKDAKVIIYCQGGYRAANSFVVLKMLGYKTVKMYLGSWGEWGNRPELPVTAISK